MATLRQASTRLAGRAPPTGRAIAQDRRRRRARPNAVDTKMFGLLAAGHTRPSAAALMDAGPTTASDGIVEALTAYQRHLRAPRGAARRPGRVDVDAPRAGRSSSFALAAVAAAAALATVAHAPDRRRPAGCSRAAEGISARRARSRRRHREPRRDRRHGPRVPAHDGATCTTWPTRSPASPQGDLTVTVEPKSDHDVLGAAVAEMVEALRGVIAQVSTAADRPERGVARS